MVCAGNQLLVDEKEIILEINTIPSKSQYFAFTKPTEKGDKEDILVLVAFYGFNKP